MAKRKGRQRTPARHRTSLVMVGYFKMTNAPGHVRWGFDVNELKPPGATYPARYRQVLVYEGALNDSPEAGELYRRAQSGEQFRWDWQRQCEVSR